MLRNGRCPPLLPLAKDMGPRATFPNTKGKEPPGHPASRPPFPTQAAPRCMVLIGLPAPVSGSSTAITALRERKVQLTGETATRTSPSRSWPLWCLAFRARPISLRWNLQKSPHKSRLDCLLNGFHKDYHYQEIIPAGVGLPGRPSGCHGGPRKASSTNGQGSFQSPAIARPSW